MADSAISPTGVPVFCREVKSEDLPRMEQLLSRHGFKYDLPPLKVFVATVALEDEGEVRVAVAARPTVELFLLMDKDWETPGMREVALETVHEEMNKKLAELGYFDAHAWIPPKIAKAFGRRLMKKFKKFNWTRSPWPCFTAFVKR